MCQCPAVYEAGLSCKQCGAAMLIKDGTRGPFWGCSHYKRYGAMVNKTNGASPPCSHLGHGTQARTWVPGLRRPTARCIVSGHTLAQHGRDLATT
jgi:hypothetical protein